MSDSKRREHEIDFVIPVYNEDESIVLSTVDALKQALSEVACTARIIVVNDGSADDYSLAALREREDITLVEHESNMGYGTALKSGILSGSAPWIAILDADGTYPVTSFPVLIRQLRSCDMVVGTRTGDILEIPLLRRFPKHMLNRFASIMSGRSIEDLNSGMRIFSRDLCYYLWGFFPRGFSFTSTLTMGSLMGGFRIHDVPINYYKRKGQSSIHPIKDTIRFFLLVCRLGLIFAPMRLFFPIALFIGAFGILKGCVIDYWMMGTIGNITQTSILGAIQIFMMGLIGQLIVWNRTFAYSPKQEISTNTKHPQKLD